MARTLLQLCISLTVILLATWLSKKQPVLAGFVTSLPITTMLVLFLSHLDGVRPMEHAAFSKSLLLAIPLSSTFLVPFILAPKLGLGFWGAFASGLALIAAGYGIHRAILGS